jgi:phage nucleotide-binding protein
MNALIYAPSGGGKTVCSTLVAAPNRGKNLLLCSDNSHIVLNNEAFKRPNLTVNVVSHWLNRSATGEPQEYFTQQFESAVNEKKYDTIIVDNISDIFDMAILEFDEHGKIKDPRQYYLMVYQELKRLARKAAQVDCNVLFTAWTDLQQITLPTGDVVTRTQPKLPNKILDNFLGLTQIVGYVTTAADSNGNRRWYYHLEGAPTMYAKDQAFNRKNCLPENIFTAPEVKK